jgi:signal-transduction protein with cAMP-binding, CBS, and nucleotidyltransferase domain
MKTKMKMLTPVELEILKRHFPPILFEQDFDLVYEEQVPNTGLVLIKGEVELVRRRKVKDKLGPGAMLGIHQLIHNRPVVLGCRIKAKSEVIILHKSNVLELLHRSESELRPILADLVQELAGADTPAV